MSNQLTTKERLNLETAEIEWKELELFFAQGKLLVIAQDVDLLDVSAIVAENRIKKLEALIAQKKVEFATPYWVTENCSAHTLLWAVVVSPYVLTQLKK